MSADTPVKPRRRHDRELWVGLFVLLGIGSVLTVLYTMTNAAMFRGRYLVTTNVPDAGGIRKGDPVAMRGVNIGRVNRFRIKSDGVEVRLELEGEYKVPVDSKVMLKAGSFLGGMIADIVPGTSAELVKGGGVLQGGNDPGLSKTTQELADSSKVVLERVKTALSEETVQHIQKSAASVESGTAEAHQLLTELRRVTGEQDKELKELTASLKRSAAGLESAANRPELERAIARLDGITTRLDQTTATVDRATTSLETVVARIERGEGTLGRLTKDDALYVNMNEASQNLSRLLEDLRKNPKRYVKLSLF